ncbi:MAG: TonB-dependent receptor [Zoogloeaceae bacterium]|nr:TonB-dependent receptor [Zoogloeaceae bacterium]
MKHLNIKLSTIVTALIGSVPAGLYAADSTLDPIVVTATRQATRVSDLMADVTVIGKEEIEQAGQTTLEQLLARQPGIQYTANGGPGTNSSLFIRGASQKQSIVLIDGVRFGSATTGDAALSRIPLSQIERIEILRGPASSLYGADAIGGVIQIFTKRGNGDPKLNASTGFGTYNTNDSSVGVSGGTELVSYSLQGGYYATDGFSAIHNKKNSSYNRDSDGYRNNSLTGSLSLRPQQGHEISANFLVSDGTSRYDSSPKARDYKNDQDVAAYGISSRNRITDIWSSTLRISRSTDKATQIRDHVETGYINTTQDQYVWQNDIKLPVGTALLATEYLKQSVSSSTNFAVNERTIRSLLAGWTGGFGNHSLQANLRRDDNSQFGGKTTGTATYGYQIDTAWRAHVAYGTAFRAPTFNELYFPNTFGALYAGNPNLKPENSRNTEAGITWERNGQNVSVVQYHNKVDDLIIGYPLKNVSSATLEGTTLSYSGNFAAWSGGISVDLLRARDDDTGNRLPRRADKQMSSHLSHHFGKWTLGGEWQLVGMRYDDAKNTTELGGYGLLNLIADYRLEKDWILFARANNVFDKYYETANNYATPGASIFVGIRYVPR